MSWGVSKAQLSAYRDLWHPAKLGCLLLILLSVGQVAIAASTTQPAVELAPELKHRAEALTGLFENDTLDLQYAYIENIHDGRGYTAGRAGFCTGTGDFYDVVRRYCAAKPNNALAKYLPRLKVLAKHSSSSTVGLEDIVDAWPLAAKDADFRAVQDAVVDDTYYRPAMIRAADAGATSPLTLAAIYDTIIQHGEGDDPDGLPAILAAAAKAAGGTPKTGVAEKVWLKAFLDARRAILAHAHDAESRKAWAQSVDRVDVYLKLLADGNLDLAGPLKIRVNGHDATVP